MLTVGFSQLRSNLTSVTNRVIDDGEEITVFKRNQPVFKIVPFDDNSTDKSDNSEFVAAADRFINRYESVFERLAK